MTFHGKTVSLIGTVLFLVVSDLIPAAGVTTNLVPVADTCLRSTTPDSNYGGLAYVPVGVSAFSPAHNRGLFRFDLTGIPSNALITSVTFRLIVTSTARPAASFDVDRLLVDWGEGTNTAAQNAGGSPATIGEASWNSRMQGIATWTTPGGQPDVDYVSTPSAANLLDIGTNDFSSAGLAADVQMWVLNPGTNFGWLVMATGEPSGTGKQLGSREDPLNSPVLIVDYELPQPPTPPVLSDFALTAGQFHFSFNAQSNRTYTVEYRDSLTITSWNFLTNVPAQPADMTISITNTISSAQRYFRVWTPLP